MYTKCKCSKRRYTSRLEVRVGGHNIPQATQFIYLSHFPLFKTYERVLHFPLYFPPPPLPLPSKLPTKPNKTNKKKHCFSKENYLIPITNTLITNNLP